jgi:YD repeat-containing protein
MKMGCKSSIFSTGGVACFMKALSKLCRGRFTYNSEGRLSNVTDRGLVPWRYAYDQDLLIRETNRNGLSFHFAYKGEGKEARCVHTSDAQQQNTEAAPH